jgi:hypothetical protein
VGNNGTNYFDMNKLIDIFDEEQELLYQRAIKQWQDKNLNSTQQQPS